jgi:hypothetical protein
MKVKSKYSNRRNFMKMHAQFLSSFLSVLFVVGFGLVAQATDIKEADSKMNDPQAKMQMHEHMADMHKKAADCLRSGKAESECHDAMMTECKSMGDMDCPMMGDMKMMHKNMYGKMKHQKGSLDQHNQHHMDQ